MTSGHGELMTRGPQPIRNEYGSNDHYYFYNIFIDSTDSEGDMYKSKFSGKLS